MSLMFDIQELHAAQYARLKRFADVVLGLIGTLAARRGIPACRVARPDRQPRDVLLQAATRRQGRVGVHDPQVPDDEVRRAQHRMDRARRPAGRARRAMAEADSHLDELPQVINVLRGDLSFVGPRPEQPAYVEELRQKIPFYDVRHLVHPGLTGWAQVKFDYGATVADALEKLQYEFFYLRHQSLSLDAQDRGADPALGALAPGPLTPGTRRACRHVPERLRACPANVYGPAAWTSAERSADSTRPSEHEETVANIRSQIKRNRQNEKRRLRNKSVRSEMRTRTKRALQTAEQGTEDAAEQLRLAVKRIDKAAAQGSIHKNQAANRKSRLMRRVEPASSLARLRRPPGLPARRSLALLGPLGRVAIPANAPISGEFPRDNPRVIPRERPIYRHFDANFAHNSCTIHVLQVRPGQEVRRCLDCVGVSTRTQPTSSGSSWTGPLAQPGPRRQTEGLSDARGEPGSFRPETRPRADDVVRPAAVAGLAPRPDRSPRDPLLRRGRLDRPRRGRQGGVERRFRLLTRP